MTGQPIQILLIEDNPGDARLLQRILAADRTAPAEIIRADRLAQGIERLSASAIDAVLLDLSLPDSTGLDTLKQMRVHAPTIPIVVLTGVDDEAVALEAVRLGAQDYLVKGRVEPEVLSRTLRYAIERKRTEAALRQAEENYRGIFENAVEGIYQSSPQGRFTSVNSAMARLLGYASPDEVITSITSIQDQFYADPDRRTTALQQLEQKGTLENFESECLRKDGSRIWISENARAVRDADGTLVHYEGFIQDITERKRAEEVVRESETRFSTIFRTSPVGISVTRLADGQISDVNDTFLGMFGYVRTEVIGHTTLELEVWANPAEREQVVKALREQGRIQDLETQFRKKSGEIGDLLVSAELIDLAGKQYMLSIMQDTTERKHAEEALRESEARYRLLAENASDIIFTMDMDLCFTYISPSVTRMRGYTVEEAMAQTVFEVLTPASLELAMNVFQEVLESEAREPNGTLQTRTLALEEICKDGSTIWTETTFTFLRNAQSQPTGILGITRDITERKRAEEALHENEKKVQRLLEQQIAVNQLALALGENLDLDEVYHTIYKHIQKLVDAWYFIVSSYDDQTNLIRAEYAVADHVLDVSAFPPILLGEPGQGTQSRVIHTGEPLYTPDHQQAVTTSKTRYTIEADGSIHKELPSEKDQKDTTRSAVYAPMKIKGKTIGILQVQSRQLDAYRPEDISLLASLANVAAVAIQNAKLHTMVLRELTERKQAETQLRKLSRAVEQSPACVVITDPTGRIEYVNPKFTQLTGYALEEVMGENPRVLKSGWTPSEEYKRLWDTITSGGEWRGIFHNKKKNGELYWESAVISPIVDAQGAITHLMAVKEDISARKQAEQEIYQRNQELATLNQIGQALSQLSAPAKIFETIAASIGRVLDNRNLFIARYDEASQQISFPVYTIHGERRDIAGRRFGNGLTEYVIRTNAPLLVRRDLPGVIAERGIDLLGEPAQSFLAVPMCTGDNIIGVIALQDYDKENVYDEHHLELLTTIAAQAATALENARLFAETQRRTDELAALNRIATAVSQSLNLDDVLNAALDELMRTLHLPKAWVYLLDPNTASLVVRAERGWSKTINEHDLLRLGEGLSGSVAQDGQPRTLNIENSDLSTRDKLLAIGYRAIAAVPLLSEAGILGVLGVASEERDRFKETEVRWLSAVGNTITVALENARLFAETKRRTDELAALNRIGQALSKLAAPPEIFEMIFAAIGQILDNQNFFIALYDEVNQQISFPVYTIAGERIARTARPFANGSTEYVIRTKAPLFLPRNAHAARLERGIASTSKPCLCFISVPLLVGETVLGVIALQDYEKENVYNEHHLELLTTIAAQAAATLANTRLFKETTEYAQRQKALYEISTTLARVHSTRELCTIIVSAMREILQYPFAGIFLIEPATGDRVLQAQSGWADVPENWRHSPGQGLSENAFLTGTLQYTPDVTREPKYVVGRADTRSEVDVPIKISDTALGVLVIEDPHVDAFDALDFATLQAVANQLAVALEHARLFEEQQASLAMTTRLYELSAQVLTAPTIEETAHLVIETVRAGFSADACTIHLFNETGAAAFRLSVGFSPNFHEEARGRPHGLTARARESKEPIIVTSDELNPRVRAEGIQTNIALPLPGEQENIGVLFVSYRQLRQFSERERNLMSLFANQAAMALGRVRLFEEQQASLAMTTRLYELSTQMLTAPTIEETARLVTETVRAGFSADACTINFFSETAYDDVDFRLSVGFSPEFDQEAQRRPQGLTARVRASTEPIIATAEELNPRVRAEGIQTNIALPLPGEKENIGALFVGYRQPRQFSTHERNLLSLFANQAALALRRARLLDETRQRAAQQTALNTIIGATNNIGTDIEAILEIALDHTLNALGLQQGAAWLIPSQSSEHLSVLRGLPREAPDAVSQLPPPDQITLSDSGVVNDSNTIPPPIANRMAHFGARAAITVPLVTEGQRIGGLSVASPEPRQWSPEEIALVEAVGHQLAIAAERARLFRETQQRLAELEAVNKVSTALRAATTLDEMFPILMDELLKVLHADSGILSLFDPERGELHRVIARGWMASRPALPIRPNEGIAGHVFSTSKPHITREFLSDPLIVEAARSTLRAGWGGACVPIRSTTEVIGTLFVAVPLPREISQEELHLLTTLAEIAGNAIQRTRLHGETEQHLQRLTALRTIDNAINASLDLRVTLNVVLGQIVAQLGVDAAAVLLLNPHTQTLEHAASRGFRSPRIQKMSLRLGEGFTGRAALERRTQFTADLPGEGAQYTRAALLANDNFITYYGVPLIAKGAVKGVLEIFHRAPLTPNAEWVDFLEALGGQVAIAIDNSELFDTLQHTNSELVMAYDATIEGWSRALDLRDHETEGHTQRVTELTVRLARMMSIDETHLIHIRRGVLLHDIGKVGIPDSILLKPGALTPTEWEVMRQHPVYALDLLVPIAYLRPAIDIPYCHHEKWDGTGYPRGLRGEEIPLGARIFAVIDVWDALSSNRPYRPAWKTESVREHIRAQSGIHFDPRVVEVFLEMQNSG